MSRSMPSGRFRVVIGDDVHIVRVKNADYVAWDMTSTRKKWGTSRDVPFLFATFLTWNAARRSGITTLSFDGAGGWVESVEDVDPIREDDQDDEDQESDTVDPSPRAAEVD